MRTIDLQDKLFVFTEEMESLDEINDDIFYKSLQLVLQEKLFDLGLNRLLLEINEEDKHFDDMKSIRMNIWNPAFMDKNDGWVQYCNYKQHKYLIMQSIINFFDEAVKSELEKPSLSLSHNEQKFKIKITNE